MTPETLSIILADTIAVSYLIFPLIGLAFLAYRRETEVRKQLLDRSLLVIHSQASHRRRRR